MSYRYISTFGQSAASAPSNNPLTYCVPPTVDSGFLHGGIGRTLTAPESTNCRAFMAEYCATNGWNNVCEMMSQNNTKRFSNQLQLKNMPGDVECKGLTEGDILIANTAARKYLKQMNGDCELVVQPFNPLNPASPAVTLWRGNSTSSCVPVYGVDPKTIDNDPVMHKLLDKPMIAWQLLTNIHNTALREGTLHQLQGTRLHNFFMGSPFQTYLTQSANLRTSYCKSSNKCG